MLKIDLTLDDEFHQMYNTIDPEMLKLSGLGRHELDIGMMSHSYFTDSWSEDMIDPNANSNAHSPINYGNEIIKPQLKMIGMYLLHRYLRKDHSLERADELIKNVIAGDYYFHDASGVNIQIPYCFAFSTHWTIANGMPWGQLHSKPPKKAQTFIGQVVETTMDMSHNFAGAVAPADVLVGYSYFAKKENLTDKEIEDNLQTFVHILNKQFRPGNQSVFSNIAVLDKYNLEKLFSDMVYPDGSSPDFDYIMKVQEIFLKWFTKGDPVSGLPYRFPIVTANIATDEENNVKDKDFLALISKYNTKLGCLNIHSGPESKLASCCRLVSDPARMRQFNTDTFGNGGLSIGSHRVVTINLPRIAYQSKGDWSKFYQILVHKLCDVKDLLVVHRERILKKRVEQGFLNMFNVGLVSMNHFFSTIGFAGIYEALRYMKTPIEGDEGYKKSCDIVGFMDNFCEKFSEETGYPFNLEETPAEGAAVNLCRKDKLLYPEEVEKLGVNMYSNQFYSLQSNVNLMTKLKRTGKLMKEVSGGAIMHFNISEEIKNPEIMEKLIEYSIKQGILHFAINYGFAICENEHSSIGDFEKCPICDGEIVEHLTRVVGYFVPVSSWNKTRQEDDFPERVWYDPNNKS